MSEWLWGDGWRYHLLSAILFLFIAVPVGIANAYFDWPIGVTYAAVFVALVLLVPLVERKDFLRSPPPEENTRSRKRRRAGAA